MLGVVLLRKFQLEKSWPRPRKAVFNECAKLDVIISLNYCKKYLLVPISTRVGEAI